MGFSEKKNVGSNRLEMVMNRVKIGIKTSNVTKLQVEMCRLAHSTSCFIRLCHTHEKWKEKGYNSKR